MGDPQRGEAEHKHERPPGALDLGVQGALRSWKLWILPLAVVVGVMGLLGAMYMAPVVNPQEHLTDYPIVIVNDDTGAPEPGGGAERNLGKELIDGFISSVDQQYPGKFDLEVVDRNTALTRLDNAQAYGAMIIPDDFSASSFAFLGSAIGNDKVDQPTIQVLTNPGVGAIANEITATFFTQAMPQLNEQFGQQLTAALTAQTDAAGVRITGAGLTAIANPIDVQVSAANPLPDNAGSGLTAFYYALLLILAGFTGTMIIQTIIDGRLGFGPIELGPVYQLRKRIPISRLGTLVVKWWTVFLVALIMSALFVGICTWVGMYTPNKMALWMFGVLVITAVGVMATSIIAIFGSAGLIINLVFFVILGLPTSGGTVPLEAEAGFFRGLAVIEPLHQAFMGARSILFFDANAAAGLGDALIMFSTFLLVGLVIGPIACIFYDRRGLIRRPPEPTSAPAHAADA
ncbi:YhgE/Pip-like protein [Williamsia limnetica]|uniref:YhgE/Pip-like protein n=1 Tax=Williamsia limnetica TaxID=882452 RepID=A0A318RJK9_WILLI|nr:DUF3533 domain-containing protein [Williamsia limnetica]PYE15469.1 YhgE/Pip-like protein [Williamsia limnetica]